MISKTIIFAVLCIAIAYLYTLIVEKGLDDKDELERSIIEAWNSSITEPKLKFRRISVGINCNLDLIVSGVELLEALGQKPGQSLDAVSIESLEDLTNTFTHYFQKGSAAERNFLNKELYRKIIETGEKQKSREFYVGGNAALMAAKISELFPNVHVQLVGPIGSKLRDLLPSSIHVPDDSMIESDEVHLIMEYGLDEQWGGLQAPVANRFITSYDESNSRLTMLDKFFTDTAAFDPDLVLLSGLHLLESESFGYVVETLGRVKVGLSRIDPAVATHLELASMVDKDCVGAVLDKVVPEVTSLGLNEQELTFISHVRYGPHADEFLTRQGQPEIYKMSDMVLWILKNYGYSESNPSSKLTRVHFHSLTYHIIATVPGAWRNSKSAVAAGTRLAGRQACDTQYLSPLDIELRIPETFKLFTGDVDRHFDEKAPVSSYELEGLSFHFSPVLVCKSPQKTVGLGDAISSTGLMYSEFNSRYES